MSFFQHFATGIALLFSSVLGLHGTSPATPVPVSTATVNTEASTTVDSTGVAATSAPAPVIASKKSSFLGSLISAGTAVITSTPKTASQPVSNPVAQATASVVSQPPVVVSTPSATPPQPSTASIDETQVQNSPAQTGIASFSSFTLSGKSSASKIAVVIVDAGYSGTDWSTVSGDSTAQISYISVANNQWSILWKGVMSGNHKVLVYDNSTHVLLTTGNLLVAAPSVLTAAANIHIPVTIGLGQSASNGVVEVTLLSVTNPGNVNTVTLKVDSLTGKFTSQKFTAHLGDEIPKKDAGFQDDPQIGTALNISVADIATPEKTVTLTFRDVQGAIN